MGFNSGFKGLMRVYLLITSVREYYKEHLLSCFFHAFSSLGCSN